MRGRHQVSTFAWAQGALVCEFVLLFILTTVLARLLGPGSYGKYASLSALAVTVSAFTGLGLEEVVARDIAQTGRFAIGNATRWAFTLRAAVAIVACLVFVGLGYLAPHPNGSFGVTALLFATTAITSLYWATFLALGRTKEAALIRLTGVLLFLAAATVVAALRLGYVTILGASAVSSFAAIVLYLLRFGMPLQRPLIGGRGTWKFALPVAVLNGTNFILGKPIDVFFLALLASSRDAAYYSIAFALVLSADTLMLSALGRLALPSLVRAAEQGAEELARACQAQMRLNLYASLPALATLIVASPLLVSALYGSAYSEVARLIPVLAAFALTSRIIGGGTQITALLAQGRQRVALGLRLAFALLNIGLDLLLIPSLGGLGAALATGSSGITLMLAEWWALRRSAPIRFPLRTIGPIVTFDILLVAIGLTITTSAGLVISLAASALAGILCGAASYVAIFDKSPGGANGLFAGFRFAPDETHA